MDTHSLHKIFAPTAEAIRSLALQPDQRGFCVVDDTETGPDQHHPAHAAIKVCDRENVSSKTELELKFAREVLKNAFLQHELGSQD